MRQRSSTGSPQHVLGTFEQLELGVLVFHTYVAYRKRAPRPPTVYAIERLDFGKRLANVAGEVFGWRESAPWQAENGD